MILQHENVDNVLRLSVISSFHASECSNPCGNPDCRTKAKWKRKDHIPKLPATGLEQQLAFIKTSSKEFKRDRQEMYLGFKMPRSLECLDVMLLCLQMPFSYHHLFFHSNCMWLFVIIFVNWTVFAFSLYLHRLEPMLLQIMPITWFEVTQDHHRALSLVGQWISPFAFALRIARFLFCLTGAEAAHCFFVNSLWRFIV